MSPLHYFPFHQLICTTHLRLCVPIENCSHNIDLLNIYRDTICTPEMLLEVRLLFSVCSFWQFNTIGDKDPLPPPTPTNPAHHLPLPHPDIVFSSATQQDALRVKILARLYQEGSNAEEPLNIPLSDYSR